MADRLRILTPTPPTTTLPATPRLPVDGQCWTDIASLKWTASPFSYRASYIFTTPAHQNSWGYVDFILTNNVVPYAAVCSASSNTLSDFFYGTVDYACALPAEAPSGASVKFRYNRISNQLDIEESLLCTESGKAATFRVTGSTTVDLQCTDATTVTEDWKPGLIYSHRAIKCQPIDVTFQPAQVVGY
ncbi:hypothetical protein VTJ83DRAFT_6196 [Remersonia thermophila]|uniref:AA1-like domain-containing protein n=1 Tax=Remersonia thermophila TaxID=72144 RepID=A0ABR4D3Z7_9PEZI